MHRILVIIFLIVSHKAIIFNDFILNNFRFCMALHLYRSKQIIYILVKKNNNYIYILELGK